MSSLRREHMAQVDSMKAEFARHHSQSEVAALHSQLSAMEVKCHLMRERLEAAEGERDRLRGVKEREEVLSQQVKQLSRQLVEAKRHHTPVRGLLGIISLLTLFNTHFLSSSGDAPFLISSGQDHLIGVKVVPN